MEDRANVHGVVFGTGLSVFQSTILPAIERAEKEVIFVTCFWARSQTRDALNESLLKLSSAALQRRKKIRVRIGFSSSSLFQKLLHTSSPEGHIYPPSQWAKKLGFLAEEDLAGLDLELKSKFFLPFSVWHPKFVIIDRKWVFLPSCNVSWEDWFEGCVELSGPIVDQFIEFWQDYWASDEEPKQLPESAPNSPRNTFDLRGGEGEIPTEPHVIRMNEIACKFLPSPHCRNPNFRLPWQTCAPPPKTPLNTELLDLFAGARKEIRLQTPNITAPPVLDALKDALKRGVNISILTSEKLMILEQLVTAGTTTARCVTHLIKYHRRLQTTRTDEEAGLMKPGRLQISYYVPKLVSKSGVSGGAEPVQSHLKLTVVDNNVIVFGSGNMDRASWYTSQELGVAFFSSELSAKTLLSLQAAMKDRTKEVYDSGT